MMDGANKTPNFPVFDLDGEWSIIGLLSIIMYEPYFYSTGKNFRKYFLGHKVVDLDGYAFTISGIKDYAKWRRFVPFIRTGEMIFRFTGERFSLDEIKEVWIAKEQTLVDEISVETINERKNTINSSNTIEELYLGKENTRNKS